MCRARLALGVCAGVLILQVTAADSGAAPQPRLHLPARIQSGAVELVVRLPYPEATVWVRATSRRAAADWVRVADRDKRECENDVHVAVLAVPGRDRAGDKAVNDAITRALSPLRQKNGEIRASVSVVLRQRAELNQLTSLPAATAQLGEEEGGLGDPPESADVVMALGNAKKLLDEQRAKTQATGRYLALLVVDGTVDLKDRQLGDKARELTEAGIELYRVATGRLVSSLDDYAGFANGPDLATAGDLLHDAIGTCHVIRVTGLGPGMTRLQLANGASGPDWPSPEVTVSLSEEDLETGAKQRDSQGWVWALLVGGAVLLGGALWMSASARRRSRMGPPNPHLRGGGTSPLPAVGPMIRRTIPLQPGGGLTIQETIPLQPAGGKTMPISPVGVSSRPTVLQRPPTGLAAWLVVYRHGTPCETLVLQTIGVTTIGRASSSSIQLEDATISKQHASITAAGGRFVLEDVTDPKPRNPTKVNDHLLEGPLELRDGMRLQIGSMRARFKCTA